jgi:hypothetical protein
MNTATKAERVTATQNTRRSEAADISVNVLELFTK